MDAEDLFDEDLMRQILEEERQKQQDTSEEDDDDVTIIEPIE